ncbi:MAG TPA: CHAT domain-containing protein [Pyrinomonadaceae bacterium]|nr:CHAT domain-containing protein [Pyrinomonadaceae bacterium]
MQTTNKTKQILQCIFLLCFAFILNISAQVSDISRQIGQAQIEFDNGNYGKAVELAENGIEKARKSKSNLLVSKGLEVIAISQINLQKYDLAEIALNEALQTLAENEVEAMQKAQIYFRLAWLRRSQRKYREAFEFGKKALKIAPDNGQIQGEYFLNIGRILFSSGYDISAIIWLEKAEKSFEKEKTNSAKLDTYRFLALAWASKLNYQTALKYNEKLISSAQNTQFKYKYRQALFESATNLSATGQPRKAFANLEKGLKASVDENNSNQICNFLNSLLLTSLDKYDVAKARIYLEQLEKYDVNNQFAFEKTLGKAVIAAFTNQSDIAENLFAQLERMENFSEFMLPLWKIRVAKRNKDWDQVIQLNQKVLELTLRDNFRDDLPAVHLDFAKAYFNLNKQEISLEHLEKSLAIIEEIRGSENTNLTLGILETYHNAYRLLTQIKSANPQESFELADFLKARFLKGRISNSSVKNEAIISPQTRKSLEELSLKFINDENLADEIGKSEKLITTKIPELNLNKPDLSELGGNSSLDNTAVISYFFTLDKNLIAFVWEKGKQLRTIDLPVSEDEAEVIAAKTQNDIKNRVFFKRDGKTIYDKLVKPLALTSKHIIFVPDKSLWKIPFQALSSDGEKYLIEEKLISYAPSVSILLDQLKATKPNRQTLQAFANSSFETKLLQYVNSEAATVAGIYNSKPIINATAGDFSRLSEKFDILHFSMHAEVASDQPLDSFLGFRKIGGDDGRLTVEELLNIKFKKGSLVFLASCDTNNVLSGEGLVSLAWAMMGSGATTVISAQWEANDKSTAIFTNSFYKNYKQGNSSAEALQKASLELIKNKANNMHEPYFWADFSLSGDFR